MRLRAWLRRALRSEKAKALFAKERQSHGPQSWGGRVTERMWMALESSVALFLLSVIAVCAVVMTVTVVMTARDARRTFRRINTLLPTCRQTLRQARRFLARSEEHTSE